MWESDLLGFDVGTGIEQGIGDGLNFIILYLVLNRTNCAFLWESGSEFHKEKKLEKSTSYCLV